MVLHKQWSVQYAILFIKFTILIVTPDKKVVTTNTIKTLHMWALNIQMFGEGGLQLM
jgi:hypothetical protein